MNQTQVNPTRPLTPSHDREAEMWVIGSVFMRPSILDDVGWLSGDDFYHDDLRQLFEAMIELRRQGKPIDIALLLKRFPGDEWRMKILEISSSVFHAQHAFHYANIVAEKSKRRQLQMIGLTLAQSATVSETPDEAMETAEAALGGIRASGERGDPIPLAKAAADANDNIDEILRRGGGGGLPTGLVDIDAYHGGLFPGELIILAARPGIGKTSLALQIANHNAVRGRLVYYASLEMSAVELSKRLACGAANVSNRLVRSGRLTQGDVSRLVESFNEQAAASMDIHDRAGITVATIRREIRKRIKKGIALAVVDYLQLLTPAEQKVPREQQVARMVRGLKDTARDYQIPVLCLCQLNRQPDEYEVPKLNQLRESGAIEQDADVVFMLSKHEPTNDKPHNALLDVAKNRNGETGAHPLWWEPSRTLFTCYSEGFAESPKESYAEFDTHAG